MKEIKAYIRESQLEAVVTALRDAGVWAVTLVPAVSMESELSPELVDISQLRPVEYLRRMFKLELVCADGDADTYAQIIGEHARTGSPGDGVIFISTVDEALHIRTGHQGGAALQ